jgi:hypothetical protein
MASQIIGEHRDGSGSVRSDGKTITISSSIKYIVVSDDSNTTREEILLNTPGLPIAGLVYGPLQMRCTSKKADRKRESTYYWDVTCDFESGVENQRQDENNPSEDPTTWIPVFSMDGTGSIQRVLTMDKSPTPKRCVNSANTRFSEPLVENKSLGVIPFTQYEDPTIDINTFLDRCDTVNETSFAGRAARTLLLKVPRAELGYYGNFVAWKVDYQMTYNRDTWDEKRLDVGPEQLNGDPCLDKKRTFKIIGNLDGSGVQQDQDVDPVEITFRTYDELDFNDFIRRG